MDYNSLSKVLDYCFQARAVPFIWGISGIGKSAMVKQKAKDMGYEFIDLRLGEMVDQGDLIGTPVGQDKHGRMLYSKPWWWPISEDGKCILFLDECNRCPPQLLSAILQLLNERKMANHVLPKEALVIAAGNPPTGDYDVRELDLAILRRFVHFQLRPKPREFFEYMKEKEFLPQIQSFLQIHQEKGIGYSEEIFNLNIEPHPRAWEDVNNILKVAPQDMWSVIAEGLVGFETSRLFINHTNASESPVKAKEILDNYDRVKPVLMSQVDPDNGVIRSDLINETVEDFKNILYEHKSTPPKEINLDSKQLTNLIQFITDLPNEFLLAFACQHLKNHQQIGEEVSNNDTLYNRLYEETELESGEKESNTGEGVQNNDGK